jgi:hypothetical protein
MTLAGAVRAEQGTNFVALLFYGSHLNRLASPESDHDFFLIVEDYARAHRSRLHAWVGGILPPSIYRRRVRLADGSEHACKISVLSMRQAGHGWLRYVHPGARQAGGDRVGS